MDPFKPEELPENWDQIVRAWVCGKSMSNLTGRKDAKVLEFVEGALVYRLVWGMEAVRVRTAVVTGEEEPPHARRAALALETGTSDFCAALLIQNGMPSRIAAMKAIRDCPADFQDVRGLRAWLKADAVISKQRDPRWPTPETAKLWRDFVSSFENPATRKWDIHDLELPAVWTGGPPPVGLPVHVLHAADRRETVIYSVDLERIGSVTPAFSREPAGIVLGKVSSSANRISVQYLGPRDLVAD